MVRLAILILLLIAGSAQAAPRRPDILPGLGRTDPRVRVDATVPPWRSVARLQAPGLMRCTAVIVAPYRAVTAAHCLWSPRLAGWIPPAALHVLAGYRNGAFAHHQAVAGYRVWHGYDPARPDDTRGADLAVLQLAGAGPAPLALAPDAPPAGTRVVLGGYNQDFDEVILADPGCAVAGAAEDRTGHALLMHTCSGTRGTSGGPLLVEGAQGMLLAGVQTGALLGAAGGVAVPAATIRRLLAEP